MDMEVMMGLFSRNKKKDKNNEYAGYIPASQRDQNYSGYNGGYDERPGRGREDDRGRGYNGGGSGSYNGGYDERPGRGREDDRSRGYNDGGYGGYDERSGQGREDDRSRGYNGGGSGSYNGGYDERPGRGREDDRSRGYNDGGYSGYGGGYDERPGQGREDDRNRGYNDGGYGGYGGGYGERPGRGYDDYGYDNRRDAAYGQPGAANGAFGAERDEWGMRNPAEPAGNRGQLEDREKPGEAAGSFMDLLDQKDIHYSFRKLQDSFDQIQAVFTGNEIPEVILNFVFDDEDGAVTIQVGDIVPQLYDGQRGRALDVVNALNCQYTFGTFTINDDNDIKFRIDALITPENAASICYALMVKALKICDESYMRLVHI